ncbi:phosphotransferase [Auraticoccus sp. F435]|uniref:Phosphotransferase n=1 Tax=Auraticoccus cholistanensis TaxID=2656650 RepID=A0A6A9UQI3_9ACTN|nr:aminoglycoside phosphotransferase family protein [Auraticoccus cholistanensis]MVA74993.1 phosphotransferase [Auraticoccus cholistanensis]
MSLPLTEIQEQTGLELRVVRRLPGGEQGGAHLVAAHDQPLVLKLQPDAARARRLLAAAPVARHGVARGWPGAEWLHVGTLADGTAFLLQELVPGRPISQLDETTVRAVVDANSRQAGLAVAGAEDDSAQLGSVLSGQHPWRALVQERTPAGAALVRRGDGVVRRLGPVALPVTDLTHGDYSSSNLILTPDGAVRFIDFETVARGTRVRDLADLYRQCFIYPGASAAAVETLRAEACAVAGPAVFATCAVAVSYNNLAWWAVNRSVTQFEGVCERVHLLLDDLSSGWA